MMSKRWVDVSSDPNSREAIEFRANRLAQSRQLMVDDRNAYLRMLCHGRRVLDVGIVAHDTKFMESSQWLHRQLAEVSASCLGVDILPQAIEEIRARGFNVMCRDIIEEPLTDCFEVIICGEVIEHIASPSALLTAARSMLTPNGRLVITTPNPLYLPRVWHGLRGSFDSVDHVAVFDASNITELAERHGMRVDSFRGVDGLRAPRPCKLG